MRAIIGTARGLLSGIGVCLWGLMPLRADEPGLVSVHFNEPDFTRPDRVENGRESDDPTTLRTRADCRSPVQSPGQSFYRVIGRRFGRSGVHGMAGA